MGDEKTAPLKKTNSFYTRPLSKFLIAGNFLSIFLGIAYLTTTLPLLLQDIFGIIILLTFSGNLFLIYLNEKDIPGTKKETNLSDTVSKIYLFFGIFAMAGMFAGSFLISSSYSEKFINNIAFYLLLYIGYFSLSVIGLIYTVLPMIKKDFSEKIKTAKNRLIKKTVNISLYILMFIFIYLAFALLIKFDMKGPAEVIVSQLALFISLSITSTTILILKLNRAKRGTFFYRMTALIGLSLLIIFLLPFISMPFAFINAEKDFAAAFGDNWDEKISPADNKYFSESRFLIPAYFLGAPSKNYVVEKDILYYKGEIGVDENITLYYDAYFPEKNTHFEDKRPVLIRIHGGAWVSGGKGLRNMMQVNKYFAGQGYAVFDVQYGLTLNLGEGPGILGAPNHLIGSFILDDMLRHLGIFTKHLEEKADDYSIDLKSVFVSGASAGGHLSTAVALAINNGKYAELFSSALTIKGFIPFYPGNKYHKLPEIGGSPELLNVELLINEKSPPCLIFQGTHDGLVPPSVSFSFQDAYAEAGLETCAVLLMPFGAHASDLGFSTYYNQLFIYYMERFMALYR